MRGTREGMTLLTTPMPSSSTSHSWCDGIKGDLSLQASYQLQDHHNAWRKRQVAVLPYSTFPHPKATAVPRSTALLKPPGKREEERKPQRGYGRWAQHDLPSPCFLGAGGGLLYGPCTGGLLGGAQARLPPCTSYTS